MSFAKEGQKIREIFFFFAKKVRRHERHNIYDLPKTNSPNYVEIDR